MKIRILFAFVAFSLFSSASGAYAYTPYAIYCEDDTTLYFVYTDDVPSVGGSFNDRTITEFWKLPTDAAFYGCQGAEGATKIVIDKSIMYFSPVWCYGWFSGLNNVTEIKGIEYIDTRYVENMTELFKDCASLTSLDLSLFDTSKLRNAARMFSGCSGLTSLDLSNFDAPYLATLDGMFNGCSSLVSLDLSSFDPVNTISAGDMFKNCNSLRFVDLSSLSKNVSLKSISDQIPGTPLIFSNDKVWVDRVNFVAGDYCANLVIDNTEADYHQLLLNIPYAFSADNVTIKRYFAADKPYTLYMPFAIDAQEFGTFFTGGELNESGNSVSFSEIESSQTQANQPYLFIPKEEFADGITISGTTNIQPTKDLNETDGLNGVYEKKVFTTEEAAQMVYYGWASGEFRRALEGASVDAGRAYFKIPQSAVTNAPARLNVKFEGKGSSGVTFIDMEQTEEKSPAYNISGQRVDENYKGIVVRSGKKTISR